jgi:hypothetical protein
MADIILKKAVQNLELTKMELHGSRCDLTFKNPGYEHFFYIGERFTCTVSVDEKLTNAIQYFLDRNEKSINPNLRLNEPEKLPEKKQSTKKGA